MSTRRIGLGMIGAGWMGQALLQKFLARPDVQLVGLYTPDAGRGREALQAVGQSPDFWTPSLDQLLAKPDLDAVCIVSPNGFHGSQSLAALRAGKHVFCEKPAATKYDEFRQQIEWERTHPHQITMVDYILYFDSFEQRLRQMIADGLFGTVTQIQINYRHPVNITGRKVWKLKADQIGDAIGMAIIHALSVMVFAMQSQAKPCRVFATSQSRSLRGFEVPPIWDIHVEFDNGATGTCLGNIDHGLGYDAYHHVHGTDGALVFDSLADRPSKVRYWSAKQTGSRWVYPLDPNRCDAALLWPPDTSTPDSGDVIHHQTAAAVNHFLDCIQRGQQSPLSFANSALIAEVGWAALMSAMLRRPVDVPLNPAEAKSFFGG
ncbi:MAG: Gfo/Idh/MocA family oxidoreductase [Verrucomicrobiae bacterium]|nr:Gfo/Idh/MocA family oxidoreductase [Verrucomicrobiae bacterium]